VLDYASDSEAQSYTPSLRSTTTGLSLPAATRRSLGLTNGRSNSLPRDFIRGGGARGGRRPNVGFDKRGLIPDLSSSMAGRRALLLASGLDSQDESDGAASAPETTPRRGERGTYLHHESVLKTFFRFPSLLPQTELNSKKLKS